MLEQPYFKLKKIQRARVVPTSVQKTSNECRELGLELTTYWNMYLDEILSNTIVNDRLYIYIFLIFKVLFSCEHHCLSTSPYYQFLVEYHEYNHVSLTQISIWNFNRSLANTFYYIRSYTLHVHLNESKYTKLNLSFVP